MEKGGKSRRGIAVVVIAALVGAGAIIAILAMSYIPDTSSSPAEFGDPQPRVEMIHAGERHEGVLLGSAFGEEPIPELPNPDQKSTTSISTDVLELREGSMIHFEVVGGIPERPPDFLSVDAYTRSGDLGGVLASQEGKTSLSFPIDLPEGDYVLAASATWENDSEAREISGYATYGYAIAVK